MFFIGKMCKRTEEIIQVLRKFSDSGLIFSSFNVSLYNCIYSLLYCSSMDHWANYYIEQWHLPFSSHQHISLLCSPIHFYASWTILTYFILLLCYAPKLFISIVFQYKNRKQDFQYSAGMELHSSTKAANINLDFAPSWKLFLVSSVCCNM